MSVLEGTMLKQSVDVAERHQINSKGANIATLQDISTLQQYIIDNRHQDYLQSIPARKIRRYKAEASTEAYHSTQDHQARIPPEFAQHDHRTKRFPEDLYLPQEHTILDVEHGYPIIRNSMKKPTPVHSTAEMMDCIKHIHHQWYNHREHLLPGQWKPVNNHRTGHLFVEPNQVEPTLQAGWPLVNDVPSDQPRSAMIEYLITATHPFIHGNGQIARLMANEKLELHHAQRSIHPFPIRQSYWNHFHRFKNTKEPLGWLKARYNCQYYTQDANTPFWYQFIPRRPKS